MVAGLDRCRHCLTLLTCVQGGRVCTIRDSRGDDEMAACGQLGGDPNMPLTFKAPPPIFEAPPAFQSMMASLI